MSLIIGTEDPELNKTDKMPAFTEPVLHSKETELICIGKAFDIPFHQS